jgi:hypothetical protein
MENALMKKNNLFWVVMIGLISTLACSLLGGGGSESAASNVSLGESEPAEAAAPIEAPVVEDVEEVNAAEHRRNRAGSASLISDRFCHGF